MRSKDKTKFNYKSAIIVSIIAIFVMCLVSLVFGVLSPDTLPVNYVGAALSSIIGALITLVLLQGQTDIEEKKGKDIKILEKKAEVFRNYITDVWKVWKNQKITIEDFQELTSKYYQDLMIYLNKERLKTIGNNLSAMGSNIGKDDYSAITKLQDSIISVINELSDELELGGRVDKEIMEEHDRIVFPLWFKNQILEEADKALSIDNIFEKGKFEFIQEAGDSSPLEYLCFEFKEFKGCKIAMRFVGKAIEFCLYIDTKYHKFDDFRTGNNSSNKYWHLIRIGFDKIKTNDLLKHIEDIEGEKDAKDYSSIIFSDENSMKEYRTEKRGFAPIFANRIKYYYDNAKIVDIKGKIIVDGILEFLKKYYEEQT